MYKVYLKIHFFVVWYERCTLIFLRVSSLLDVVWGKCFRINFSGAWFYHHVHELVGNISLIRTEKMHMTLWCACSKAALNKAVGWYFVACLSINSLHLIYICAHSASRGLVYCLCLDNLWVYLSAHYSAFVSWPFSFWMLQVVDVGSSRLVHTFTPCRELHDEQLPPSEPPITRMFTSSDGQWLAAVNCFGDVYVFNLEILRFGTTLCCAYIYWCFFFPIHEIQASLVMP